jgi:hypothetical protein
MITLGNAVQLLAAKTALATAVSGTDAGMPSSEVCGPIPLAVASEGIESVSPDTKRTEAQPAIRAARRRVYR